MKQLGCEIIGDAIKVDSYTSGWLQVKLHPIVFYRRYEEFVNSFEHLTGLYAEIEFNDFVVIRFSNKEDMTTFHRIHHEYI